MYTPFRDETAYALGDFREPFPVFGGAIFTKHN